MCIYTHIYIYIYIFPRSPYSNLWGREQHIHARHINGPSCQFAAFTLLKPLRKVAFVRTRNHRLCP